MEEDQEYKHVCKFCNKRFLCGRSLGGHMRSHMLSNSSAEPKDKLDKKIFHTNNKNNTDFEAAAGGTAGGGYGLRENPKKTKRLSDSIDEGDLKREKICEECGKGFRSWKALFGHMRCHTEKVDDSLGEEEEDIWIDDDHHHDKGVMDSQSDNEAVAPKRKKRSTRMRYNNKNTSNTTTTVTTSSSFSFANASTCVSEIEQEQEEVAICLMMLSRDVGGYWGGLNSVADSSDNNNNSLVFEVRSSSLVKEIGEKVDCNDNHVVKRITDRKFKSVVVAESENAGFHKRRYEFGVLRYGCVDGGDKFGKGSEVEFELRRGSFCKNGVGKYSEAEDLIKEADDDDQTDSECGKVYDSKKTRYDGKSKYKCTACNKSFRSYQALGGHRASHKRVKGCFASKPETSENSIETPTQSKLFKSSPIERGSPETSSPPSKKRKHECPVCFKVFASGQALGGHKRSHGVVEGGSEARASQPIVIQTQQRLPEFRDLLDLNLPAPIEDEESNARIGYNQCWVGNNHNHEPPVGLISNS